MITNNVDIKQENNGLIIQDMAAMEHEQVGFCYDKETGLRAIIAIHNTNLGPALGGTRMWNYENEQDAIKDVLRLSRGMSFKASISGLDLGGGKAVIIGDSQKDKTELLMRKFGNYVETLKGRYITAKDIGMSTKDMEHIKKETDYVTGIPEHMGGSGDPSPVTAYGVYMGMKASASFRWGNDNLANKTILVQGVGHVGEHLLNYLYDEGARLIINDIDENRLKEIANKFEAEIVYGDEIYELQTDIYAPCAMGATLNPRTISCLQCSVVSGAANNQLENERRDAKMLSDNGILYAPDFLINAGGLISVYSEIKGGDKDSIMRKTEEIYNTTIEILNKSATLDITTHDAALQIAKERILSKKE